jgi:hypothetical protein
MKDNQETTPELPTDAELWEKARAFNNLAPLPHDRTYTLNEVNHQIEQSYFAGAKWMRDLSTEPSTSHSNLQTESVSEKPQNEAPETAIEFLSRLGMDGKKWTDEFLKLKPDATDFGVMIGWFCNAIMAGYDRANADNQERIAELEVELDAALAGANIEAKRADQLTTENQKAVDNYWTLLSKHKELEAEIERLRVQE